MENPNKYKNVLNINDTLETNCSETQSLNDSFIFNDFTNNKKKVTFNEKINIILIKSYKKENKRNAISYDLIRENIRNLQKTKEIYQPRSQNCFGCTII